MDNESESDDEMRGSGTTRPCSISVAQLRKAVTATRRANHIGEMHADMEGKQATRIRKAYTCMEQSPTVVSDLRDMRAEVKSYFHPPVSKMSMAALQSYVYTYWTAKDLDWSWDKLEGLAPGRSLNRPRQPRGCRGSAAPGGRSRGAPVRSKRKPSAYSLFIKEYFAENFDSGDDAQTTFSDATEAWKQSASPAPCWCGQSN